MPVKAEINVTPLVDIVLVLLIIFMVITPFLLRGYDINLPPEAMEIGPPKPQLVITQSTRDKVYLNREEIEINQLELRLRAVLKDYNGTVFFAAAGQLNYGIIVSTMDVIRNSGAHRIAIVNAPRTDP